MSTSTLEKSQVINTNSFGSYLSQYLSGNPIDSFQSSYKESNREVSEYMKAQNFLKEYGDSLMNVHGLDVSYVEIECDNESVLSWYNKETKTLKSISAVDDEDGFEMQLSVVQNGCSKPGRIFKSFKEFTCEV